MLAKAVFRESGPGPILLRVAPAPPVKNGIDEAGPTATLHQLAEHITAIGNYVAAACRLREVEPPGAFASHVGDILGKAMAQVREAGRAIQELRAVVGSGDADPRADPRSANQSVGGPYRVHFLNEFARANSVTRVCQRMITIRSARSPERAVEAAMKRFARVERIAHWRVHAQIIALEVVGAETALFGIFRDRPRKGARPSPSVKPSF